MSNMIECTKRAAPGFTQGCSMLLSCIFPCAAAFRRRVPWQKGCYIQLLRRRLRCCLDEPGQIPPWIQVVFNHRLDEAEDDCTALCATLRVGKQEVISVNHEGLDTTFSTIVADLQPTAAEVVGQIWHCSLR